MRNRFDFNPEISIIVPVYKVERYLDRCVNSIMAQTFSDFELILVDDGSPDACPQMCDAWVKRDTRIKAIHKDNGGLSSARNEGLAVAVGKYICFVDSDDWLEIDAISYLHDLLLRYGADFTVGSFLRTVGVNRTAGGKEKYAVRDMQPIEESFTGKDFIKKLLKMGPGESMPYAWAKLYKRELFEGLRYPVGMTSEDWPVTFACAMKSDVVAMSGKVVYNYFINPDGITASRFGRHEFDMLKSADMVLAYACNLGADDEIRKWAALNRKRADFAVLADLMISDEFQKNEQEFAGEINALRKELSSNLPEFLSLRMPLYRKLIMLLMCYIWHPSTDIINLIYGHSRKILRGLVKK